MRTVLVSAIALGLFLVAGCAEGGGGLDKINGSVEVAAGTKAGNASTVNGGIDIGQGASVADAETVNGGIDLGEHAHANSVETVNGGIHLQANSDVAHGASSVNGELELASGSHVGGKLENVNGRITLDHAKVDGGIATNNGDITIGSGSVVHGGLHVEKSQGMWISISRKNPRKPKIVIGPDAVVEGALVFDRPVDLFVAPTAKIGPVTGATAQAYSGQ